MIYNNFLHNFNMYLATFCVMCEVYSLSKYLSTLLVLLNFFFVQISAICICHMLVFVCSSLAYYYNRTCPFVCSLVLFLLWICDFSSTNKLYLNYCKNSGIQSGWTASCVFNLTPYSYWNTFCGGKVMSMQFRITTIDTVYGKRLPRIRN